MQWPPQILICWGNCVLRQNNLPLKVEGWRLTTSALAISWRLKGWKYYQFVNRFKDSLLQMVGVLKWLFQLHECTFKLNIEEHVYEWMTLRLGLVFIRCDEHTYTYDVTIHGCDWKTKNQNSWFGWKVIILGTTTRWNFYAYFTWHT